MKRSEKIKHKLAIASIKKRTFKPYDYKWTKFYESNFEFMYCIPQFILEDKELVICSTIIDSNNLSILTTHKLFTIENWTISVGYLNGATDKNYGNFKNEKEDFVFGTVILKSGSSLKYFIETGKASMIMIQGVRKILQIETIEARNNYH